MHNKLCVGKTQYFELGEILTDLLIIFDPFGLIKMLI